MTSSNRTAGALLALSALIWIAMIAIWPLFIGTREGAATGEMAVVLDRATHLVQKQTAFRAIWIVEAAGAIGMAISGFVLMHRRQTRNSLAPLGWAAVGVGATVYIAMYGVMLGTYWPAAQMAAENPAILASAITGAMALFFLSNISLNLGFTISFAVEARSANPATPRWLAWIGAAISVLAFLASIMGLIAPPTVSAVGALDAAALVAVAHFVFIAALGFGIAREREA